VETKERIGERGKDMEDARKVLWAHRGLSHVHEKKYTIWNRSGQQVA
jgi:hypothetical protein